MQVVIPSFPAFDYLLDNDLAEGMVCEERPPLPSISRNKIDASLMNTPLDPTHDRSLRG
jgi:hypothetical protein